MRSAAKTSTRVVTASLIAAGMVIIAATAGIFSMISAFADQDKVLIIHFPDGNPDNPQILCIGEKAARAHFAEHRGDDLLGSC